MRRFAWVCTHLWCPEGLALRWRRLPERIGYTVLPVPPEFARKHWESEAAGERKRVTQGWYTKDRPIDDALVDAVVAQQQAAFVVTEASVFYVSTYPDYLQQHDSTDSWWLEVKAATEDDICSLYPDVQIHFRADRYWLAGDTLLDSFVASGARGSPNALKNAQALNLAPPPRNFVTEWFSRRLDKRILRCPVELASRWREILLDPVIHIELTSLCGQVPSPTGETFTCGRMVNWFSEITIRSGSAFDPITWNDAAFLAIDSTGFIRSRPLLNGLTKRAIEHRATLI